jgi:hypothetical protein
MHLRQSGDGGQLEILRDSYRVWAVLVSLPHPRTRRHGHDAELQGDVIDDAVSIARCPDASLSDASRADAGTAASIQNDNDGRRGTRARPAETKGGLVPPFASRGSAPLDER